MILTLLGLALRILDRIRMLFRPVCVNPLCDKTKARWHQH